MKSVPGSEAARFLGIRGKPDEATLAALRETMERVRSVAAPREVVKRFPLSMNGSSISLEGAFTLESRDLARNLEGCDEAYLFVATLGPGPDRLMRAAQVSSVAESAMIQAAAAEIIERHCDDLVARLAADEVLRGRALKPRYSPGFGDLGLPVQAKIFAALGVTRAIGVSLTDSFMMTPLKSVSAFIGVRKA